MLTLQRLPWVFAIMFNELPKDLLFPEESSEQVVAQCDYCEAEIYSGDTVVEDTTLEEVYCDNSCAKLATVLRLKRKVMQ